MLDTARVNNNVHVIVCCLQLVKYWEAFIPEAKAIV